MGLEESAGARGAGPARPSAMSGNPYGVGLAELKELNGERGLDAIKKLNDTWGGVAELCKALRPSPAAGLSDPEDIRRRQEVYGVNEIPPAPAKTFLELVWEALQDVTLIILLVSAVSSLA